MKYIYIIISLIVLLSYSCSEKEEGPISGGSGKPDSPTVLDIKEIAGGAILTYQLPDNENVLGLKCVYTLSNGQKYEVINSFYQKNITVAGFLGEEEQKITLYTVNRAQKLSKPVEIKFTPLEAPISKVIKTLNMEPDFGGARYQWTNEDRTPMNIEFITPDSTGIMQATRVYTTSSNTGVYTIRGYKAEPRVFAAIVRDNYGNVSDTIFPTDPSTGDRLTLTPYREDKLNKKAMKVWTLDNEPKWNAFGTNEKDLLDDDIGTIAHSPQNSIPASLTIDLGKEYKLSRVVLNQRNYDGHYYSWGNPKNFEIYVSTSNTPSLSGDWSEWALYEKCEIIKPSGLPLGQSSDEDNAVGIEGHSFSFGLDQEPLRYVRFMFYDTWGQLTTVHLSEVTFWGVDDSI